MGNVTLLNLTFYQCVNLTSVPTFNTVNCTNFNGTFASTNLTTLPLINTSKGTNFTSYSITNPSLTTFANIDTSNGNTSFSQFITSCNALTYVPAVNLIKAISTIDMSANPSLNRIDATNCNVNMTVASCNMNANNLQQLFANSLVGNTSTSRTITITSNPGADTPITKTANIASGNTRIVMSNTVGLANGMVGTNSTLTFRTTCTLNANASITTAASATISNNTVVSMDSISIPTQGSLANFTPYFAVNASGTTFQVSLTQGGSAVSFGDGTFGGSGFVTRIPIIVNVSTNAYVDIQSSTNQTLTNTSVTFRTLDVRKALAKNWAITG